MLAVSKIHMCKSYQQGLGFTSLFSLDLLLLLLLLFGQARWHKNKRKGTELSHQRNEISAAAWQFSDQLAGSQREDRCLSVSKTSHICIDFINCNLVFLNFQEAGVSSLGTLRIIFAPLWFCVSGCNPALPLIIRALGTW